MRSSQFFTLCLILLLLAISFSSTYAKRFHFPRIHFHRQHPHHRHHHHHHHHPHYQPTDNVESMQRLPAVIPVELRDAQFMNDNYAAGMYDNIQSLEQRFPSDAILDIRLKSMFLKDEVDNFVSFFQESTLQHMNRFRELNRILRSIRERKDCAAAIDASNSVSDLMLLLDELQDAILPLDEWQRQIEDEKHDILRKIKEIRQLKEEVEGLKSQRQFAVRQDD